VRYWFKSLICTYPTSIWRPIGGDPVGILPRSLASENQNPCAIVWRCLRHPVFSHFGTIPACDGQMDKHTPTYLASIIDIHGKN